MISFHIFRFSLLAVLFLSLFHPPFIHISSLLFLFPGSLHVFNLPLSQSSLCSAYDILQCNLRPVGAVVGALLMLECTEPKQKEGKVESDREKKTEVKKLIAESTQTPSPSWQIWDLIGSSLLHVFCLVVLFLAYSWSEFK